jgi:uncharacterized protein HemX
MHAHFAAMSCSPTGQQPRTACTCSEPHLCTCPTGHQPHAPCACQAPHLCTCFASVGDLHCICECANTYSLTSQQLNSAIQRRLRAYNTSSRNKEHFIRSQAAKITELTDTITQYEAQLDSANDQLEAMASSWTLMKEAMNALHRAGECIFSSKAERP